MTTNSRKIKTVEFSLNSNPFQCQVKDWKVVNNTPPGEKLYAQCPDGEFFEDADPDWALELAFYSDWRLNGVSDYLTAHDRETVAFVVRHLSTFPGEGTQRTGSCLIIAPTVNGEGRTTEMTEVTLPIIGKPTYTRL